MFLLLEICSAHGKIESLPQLTSVTVRFLPPNSTSRLQPVDDGVIDALKVRYRRREMEHALDLVDIGTAET